MPPALEDPARIGKTILVSRKPPAWRGVDEACDWAGLVDGDDNQGKAWWWCSRSATPRTTLKAALEVVDVVSKSLPLLRETQSQGSRNIDSRELGEARTARQYSRWAMGQDAQTRGRNNAWTRCPHFINQRRVWAEGRAKFKGHADFQRLSPKVTTAAAEEPPTRSRRVQQDRNRRPLARFGDCLPTWPKSHSRIVGRDAISRGLVCLPPNFLESSDE
ncbi:hypothetical protein B0T18DRAFT_387985 [Schizothecium vesticola]|uniref:Uncharacterized protein n=1 Tax=Schizothecium vesticola TaxID=314040 RepID=A0AA40F680_9PEZI|nr:hypothetical protein B0T18DRAFT_387985 [Schizothecium vesticola]